MEGGNVNQEEVFNNLLVMLFNEILDVEQKALITGSFKEISINDMHIIDAIGNIDNGHQQPGEKRVCDQSQKRRGQAGGADLPDRQRKISLREACRVPPADGADGHGWVPGRGTGYSDAGTGEAERIL